MTHDLCCPFCGTWQECELPASVDAQRASEVSVVWCRACNRPASLKTMLEEAEDKLLPIDECLRLLSREIPGAS